MQNQTLWQKLRAFLHRKTAEPPKPNTVTVKPPTLLWACLFFIALATIIGVIWMMKTNSLEWSGSLVATGLLAGLGVMVFAWSLHNWIGVEKSKVARKNAKEERAQARERREQAREDREATDWGEARAARIAEAAEARRLRNRGLAQRLHEFIFGRDD